MLVFTRKLRNIQRRGVVHAAGDCSHQCASCALGAPLLYTTAWVRHTCFRWTASGALSLINAANNERGPSHREHVYDRVGTLATKDPGRASRTVFLFFLSLRAALLRLNDNHRCLWALQLYAAPICTHTHTPERVCFLPLLFRRYLLLIRVYTTRRTWPPRLRSAAVVPASSPTCRTGAR